MSRETSSMTRSIPLWKSFSDLKICASDHEAVLRTVKPTSRSTLSIREVESAK